MSQATNVRHDFERDVWCVLGLIFDAVDMQSAIDAIDAHARAGTQCTFSTPNLNFTIAALSDPEFRDTVANSQLSLLDGMPLLWIARMLRTGISAKVSGSNLFERLSQRDLPVDERLRVYFFGGEKGIAEQACKRISSDSSGLDCAGFQNPGFGSLDDISTPEIMDSINDSKADFLVIALGARKGQQWIDRNRRHIQVPVVSHLGAVINFAAGNVKRAPVWMQSTGLEWIWRIYQEPGLWKRYFFDGLAFARLLFVLVVPYAIWQRYRMPGLTRSDALGFRVQVEGDRSIIRIQGSCLHGSIQPLRKVFCDEVSRSGSICLELSAVDVVDGAFLGLCVLLAKHVRNQDGTLEILGANRDVRRLFRWNGVEYLL